MTSSVRLLVGTVNRVEGVYCVRFIAAAAW